MADTMLIARSRCCQTIRIRARDEHCALRSPSFSNCGTTSATSGLLESQLKTPQVWPQATALCAPLQGVSPQHLRSRAWHSLSPRKEHIDMVRSCLRCARACCQADEGRLARNAHIEQNWQDFKPQVRYFVVWDTGARGSPGHKRRATSWDRMKTFFKSLCYLIIYETLLYCVRYKSSAQSAVFPSGPLASASCLKKKQNHKVGGHTMYTKLLKTYDRRCRIKYLKTSRGVRALHFRLPAEPRRVQTGSWPSSPGRFFLSVGALPSWQSTYRRPQHGHGVETCGHTWQQKRSHAERPRAGT